MSFLIALAARIGISDRFQKMAAWALAALGIIILVIGIIAAWHAVVKHHDNTIITTHDTAINAAASEAQAKADRVAGGNQMVRDMNSAAEAAALQEARNEAMRSGSNPWDAVADRVR